jgi:hypothetical protein
MSRTLLVAILGFTPPMALAGDPAPAVAPAAATPAIGGYCPVA